MVVCSSPLNYSPRNNSAYHSISLALIVHLIFPSHVVTFLEAGSKFKIKFRIKKYNQKKLPFQCRHVTYRCVAYRDDD